MLLHGILLALSATAVTGYTRVSQSLTSFPGDIPPADTFVDVSDNDIPAINVADLQSLSSLIDLVAHTNSLTEFPDLRPVAATILTVDFSKNSIDVVPKEYLHSVNSISTINLSENLLTVFPDFGDAKASLTELNMEENSIAQLPGQNVIGFKNLLTLKLNKNKITQLPNFCFETFSNPSLSIDLGTGFSSNKPEPSCRLRLWRHLALENRLKTIPYIQGPGFFKKLGDLTDEQLTCSDIPDLANTNKRFMKTYKTASGFYCRFPPIVKTSFVDSPDACLKLCANTYSCYHYNVKVISNGKHECHVTSPALESLPTQPEIGDEADWSYFSV